MNEKKPIAQFLSKLSLPKSTIIAGAVALFLFIALIIALIFGSNVGKSVIGKKDVVTVENGYLVINGVKTEHQIASVNHLYGEWTLYNENETNCAKKLFYRTCSECSTLEWKEGKYEDHRFNTVTTAPTCAAGGYDTKTCELCGTVDVVNETPALAHTYLDGYSSDSEGHWRLCAVCNNTSEKTAHAFADKDACTVCSEPIAATEGITYKVSADGTYVSVIAYKGSETKVRIAKNVDGLPVKVIGTGAFENKSDITSVIIPNSVTVIEKGAFRGCSALGEVIIPDSVETIEREAFYGCIAVTDVTIGNNVKSVGAYSFYKCTSLTALNLGNSVTSIGDYAFCRCSLLTSITVPDSVESIGDGAFNTCSSLASVTVGNGIKSIGSSAFTGCGANLYTVQENLRYVNINKNPYFLLTGASNTNLSTYNINKDTKIIASGAFSNNTTLTAVVIPDGVIGIGTSAFRECSKLGSVVIPNSVTEIGEGAFYLCTRLKSVTLGKGVTKIADEVFRYCYILADVYYTGSAEEWATIEVGKYNSDLILSNIHYKHFLNHQL